MASEKIISLQVMLNELVGYDVVIIDFARACDKIHQAILIDKLTKLGWDSILVY